jgi:hypothetical protein
MEGRAVMARGRGTVMVRPSRRSGAVVDPEEDEEDGRRAASELAAGDADPDGET